MKIDYPFITETDAREQMRQIRSYLCQVADTLNKALSALEEKDSALANSMDAIAEEVETVKKSMDEQHQYVMKYIDEKTTSEGV